MNITAQRLCEVADAILEAVECEKRTGHTVVIKGYPDQDELVEAMAFLIRLGVVPKTGELIPET